jgi:hypothetical protein
MYLNHITLSTGHLARTPRSEVAPAVTHLLAAWLPNIINSQRSHPLPLPELSHFSARAFVESGALVVSVYAPLGPHEQGKPHTGADMPLVTLGVAQRSRQGGELWAKMTKAFATLPGLEQPGAPWCAVALHPSLALYAGPTDWLGDFERCIAWAWLTRNPDLRPA